MKELEKVLKACSDDKRIRILKLLEKRKLCVCELAFVLGITQPSVSRHLKKLTDAGLIATEKDSFWTNYFLAPGSEYAEGMCALIGKWLNAEKTVKKDLARVKKADREKLCCKNGN
ncbi:MAG: metalloregulator ArsR/SmtB family transcription factor [Candidatus Omnitrophica bacterium]|nr:metalloregulator ArsR/SmtB family transcription factor [Candidatus Omnitrophota bacterium]